MRVVCVRQIERHKERVCVKDIEIESVCVGVEHDCKRDRIGVGSYKSLQIMEYDHIILPVLSSLLAGYCTVLVRSFHLSHFSYERK